MKGRNIQFESFYPQFFYLFPAANLIISVLLGVLCGKKKRLGKGLVNGRAVPQPSYGPEAASLTRRHEDTKG